LRSQEIDPLFSKREVDLYHGGPRLEGATGGRRAAQAAKARCEMEVSSTVV
jgi:hypothetical protein